jgi:hypothetical protein
MPPSTPRSRAGNQDLFYLRPSLAPPYDPTRSVTGITTRSPSGPAHRVGCEGQGGRLADARKAREARRYAFGGLDPTDPQLPLLIVRIASDFDKSYLALFLVDHTRCARSLGTQASLRTFQDRPQTCRRVHKLFLAADRCEVPIGPKDDEALARMGHFPITKSPADIVKHNCAVVCLDRAGETPRFIYLNKRRTLTDPIAPLFVSEESGRVLIDPNK